jgi:hypothetical protein
VGDDQDHGEVPPQHGATGVLDVAAEAEEDLGHVGHDAGAVLADDGHREVGEIFLAAFAHRSS